MIARYTVVFLFLAVAFGAASDEPFAASIGDDQLLVRLTKGTDGAITETCLAFGVEVPYSGSPAAIQFIKSDWAELRSGMIDSHGPGAPLILEGTLPEFTWRLTYEHTGPGRITKQLELRPKHFFVLARVALASFTSQSAPEIVSTGLQDIAAFIRDGDKGILVSLDFPYSRIATEDELTRVTYPPFERESPGSPYVSHTLTVGATRPSGETRYGRDTGEVAAMDAYVQGRYPQRFDMPMFVSACINNRYTMPREGMVWYTYKDHPTLSFNLDLMKRELDLMPQLGMQYYQVFPGVFDWAPDDPDRDTIKEIMRYGNERGVRIGDYSGTSQVFCAHYNEHNNALNHPEWLVRDPANNPGAYCFGNNDFVDFYIDTVVSAAKEFGFKLHCLDFLSIAPCFADHGHPTGPDSVYHQVKGLVRFMETLAEVDPELMVWSNSGNWSEFLPKIAWSNPNLYLTDPYIGTPWPGLNMTRLLDDARREQMVSLHYTRFVPYRNYTNCQYFFSQNSIVPDIRNYQYGALSSLAVTPNLCLAEIRPWMDRLPSVQQNEVKAFYATWTTFLRDNYALWKSTFHIGDDPAPGNVEVYSHANANHGFVFIVNPNYTGTTVDVPVDARLGFNTDGLCEVRERYPVDHLLLTTEGPTPGFGSTLQFDAPAQQVRVLEIGPAAEASDAPRLYGIPGAFEKIESGYFLRTRGPQGTTHRFAVCTPSNAAAVTTATVRTDEPKQAKRLFAETPLQFLGQDGPYAYYEITFRRTAAPVELRTWHATPADLATGESQDWPKGFDVGDPCTLPIEEGNLANFLGAYIDNAFTEDQETIIDFRPADSASPLRGARDEAISFESPFSETTLITDEHTIARSLRGGFATKQPLSTPTLNPSSSTSAVLEPEIPGPYSSTQHSSWWLRTRFHLPFMYTIGAEPIFDEHTILVLPMRDPSRVRELHAWVNGVPLDVRRYAYPRNRALSTYWADLVGTGAHGGDNTLVVHMEFAPE